VYVCVYCEGVWVIYVNMCVRVCVRVCMACLCGVCVFGPGL